MEIKVKSVDAIEEKSSQQIEQELLEKHQDKIEGVITSNEETPKVAIKENTPTEETPKVEEEINTRSSELSEEEVLEFIGNRYGKEIKSLDEFNQTREEAEPLPEDVSQYLKYKKETGRGIKDFYELQKDFDEMTPEKLLRDYLTATEKGLDAEDITDLMEDYSFDEDLDDEKDVKKIKLAKKKIIAKAKDYFAEEQEKYKIPLESRRDEFSENAEELEDYKQYIAEAKTEEEELSRKRDIFLKRTDDVFSEFKGFEFTLDDNKVYFSPGDANELKKIQSNPQNFIDKHKGEDGTIRDAEGYHKSLAMAMNPDKFANFFYEQGKSANADDQMRKMKNVNMTTRTAPETSSTKSGLQIKSINSDHGRGLKIRNRNK
tara:strand:+ start:9375 stop:10499 length:1125 start_codon:yes stop_codon:yes gene_type:complete